MGDGPARAEIEQRAAAVNAECGEGTVVVTGNLDDPRPAYAAADIALGMGGSALRALAYGAPLIVQGEHGF
ncbi:MAG: glycosyltransferase, partial [Microbacterium sp.]|nr:glycosyltransferase [Microbacterium sp.]